MFIKFVFNTLIIQVRGEHIIACSATEIAEKVSVIEGHEKEQPSSVAQRCARIYAECNPKPGLSSFFFPNYNIYSGNWH